MNYGLWISKQLNGIQESASFKKYIKESSLTTKQFQAKIRSTYKVGDPIDCHMTSSSMLTFETPEKNRIHAMPLDDKFCSDVHDGTRA